MHGSMVLHVVRLCGIHTVAMVSACGGLWSRRLSLCCVEPNMHMCHDLGSWYGFHTRESNVVRAFVGLVGSALVLAYSSHSQRAWQTVMVVQRGILLKL